jgi:hypothetical protein
VEWRDQSASGQTDNPVPCHILHGYKKRLRLSRAAYCYLYTPSLLYARKCLPQFIFSFYRFPRLTPRSAATHKPTRGQADSRTNFHNSHPSNPRVVISSAVRVNTPTDRSALHIKSSCRSDSFQPKCEAQWNRRRETGD